MDKYSFREFLMSCRPLSLLLLGYIVGVANILIAVDVAVHTEKHGCEYVEKAECKQVWVKK